MFVKAKYKVWLSILVVCLIYSVFVKVIPQIKADKEEQRKNDITYTIQMDTKDQALNSRIANQTITYNNANVTFLNTRVEPDIIITDKEDTYDGYEKIEGGLYTSFTIFTNRYLYKGYDDDWLNKSNEHGKDKYSKDIRMLLEAIEKGKTWGELGASKSYVVEADEPVKLYIPTKYHPSYEFLRQYIAVALNDYEPLNENNIKELTARADQILAKSKQTELSAFVEDSDIHGLLLAPESTMAECYTIFKNYTRGIIYPGKSIVMEYDLYVRPEKADHVKEITKSKGFWELFGLRSTYGNNTGEKNCLFERCFDVVDLVAASDIKLPISEIQEPVVIPESKASNEEPTAIEESSVTETDISEDETANEENLEQMNEEEISEQKTEMEENETSFLGFLKDFWWLILILVIMLIFITLA